MSNQVILWRIPRTGTTSLRHGLHLAGAEEMHGGTWDRRRPGLITFAHHTPEEVCARGWASREEIVSRINLFVVRDPWNRLVSLYSLFHQQSPGSGLRQIAEQYAPTFSEYVKWCCNGDRHTGQHERNFQARLQTDWLPEWMDDPAKVTVVPFGVIDVAWKLLKHYLCPRTLTQLPQVNGSDHPHYSTFYSDSDRRKVARHYAEEIARFGFRFEAANEH